MNFQVDKTHMRVSRKRNLPDQKRKESLTKDRVGGCIMNDDHRKELLSGNEAIARGAWEAGVQVATGYPGTPSTEILESLVKLPDVHCQWSTNEKVALEVAVGAAIAGARSMVTMKHVGVNVAADPLFSCAYTGVNGALVIVSADEPSMHSSQNEQDNRLYAKFAKIAMLEPSDSQECKEMIMQALDLSERFATPVMLRTTTRVSHSKSSVSCGERHPHPARNYIKDANRYVTMPANARILRVDLEERLQRLQSYSEESDLNRIEWGERRIGVVTSGMCYQHVKEALPLVSILKIGLSYPLPLHKIASFASQVEELYIVEELEPFMEEQIRGAGIACKGKELLPSIGELSPGIIRKAFALSQPAADLPPDVPARPPVLCPGCPHRGVFYTLSKLACIVTGDIGCYTLGALAPLNAIDTCICMGASLPMMLGMEKAHPDMARKLVAVEGDSTFLHSGMTGLLDLVYNGSTGVVMILDNQITAMTGHQHNPASGSHMDRSPAPRVKFSDICHALGVSIVYEANANDLGGLESTLQRAMECTELVVIVVNGACALLPQPAKPSFHVDTKSCRGCRLCTKVGCPALAFSDHKASILPELCVGCGLCAQLCSFGALTKDEQ